MKKSANAPATFNLWLALFVLRKCGNFRILELQSGKISEMTAIVQKQHIWKVQEFYTSSYAKDCYCCL